MTHTYNMLASIADEAGEVEAAYAHSLDAVALCRAIVDRHASGTGVNDLSNLTIPQQGRVPEALPVQIASRANLAFSLIGLARYAVKTGRTDDADGQYAESLGLIEDLYEIDPAIEPTYRTDLTEYAPLAHNILLRVATRPQYEYATAEIRAGLADVAMARGTPDRAEEHLRAALAIAEGRFHASPTEPAGVALLASVQRRLANLLLEFGDGAVAWEYANRALAGHRFLADADPKNVGWPREIDEDRHVLEAARNGPFPIPQDR